MTDTDTTATYDNLNAMILETTDLLFSASLINPDYQILPSRILDNIRIFSGGRVFNAGIVPDAGMGTSYGWENDDHRRDDDPDARPEMHHTDDLTEVRDGFMNWAARSVIAGG
jgi:hypothetical protein